jgi:hypothetical protein
MKKNCYIKEGKPVTHRREKLRLRDLKKKKVRRVREYNLPLIPDELFLLLHSVELAKIIGVKPISNNRKRKLRVMALRKEKSTKVRLLRAEIKLLVAHYCQLIICGDTDLKERLKFFNRYLGALESKNIQQQVAVHERLKDEHENQGVDTEEDWFIEEDYDTFYQR